MKKRKLTPRRTRQWLAKADSKRLAMVDAFPHVDYLETTATEVLGMLCCFLPEPLAKRFLLRVLGEATEAAAAFYSRLIVHVRVMYRYEYYPKRAELLALATRHIVERLEQGELETLNPKP